MDGGFSGAVDVLHVERDPAAATETAEAIERHGEGIAVDTVTGAGDAIDRLEADRYDCVVSCFQLPGRDGIELLEHVREAHPELPFILFTGEGSEAVASDAISAGVTDYLTRESGTGQYEVLANKIRSAVDRFRTRRELDRSQDLLAHTEQLADVGGWEVDAETGEQRWTEGTYAIHDLDPDSDFDPTVDAGVEFYHPDDRDEIARLVDRCMEHGEPYDAELRLQTARDRLRWVRTVGEPVRADGEIVTIRGAIRDITEQKERELELERKNERLDQFASTLRHEMRNPLNILDGYLDVARETGSDEAFETCQTTIDQMDRLLEQTLLVLKGSDADVGQTAVELGPTSKACWEALPETDAGLEIETTRELVADDARLTQLLGNLFRNAVEHGGPAVTVRVGDLDAGFYVEDDGPGIPPEERESVFEEGYSKSKAGTGLGLAVVEAVAAAHGWTVRITDGTMGGTRFEITGVDRP
jgi:signal transduction histidine kinase/CheY-like chemotaxis protein